MKVTKIKGLYLIELDYSNGYGSAKAVFIYDPKEKELSLSHTDDGENLEWATEEVESFIEKNKNVLK